MPGDDDHQIHDVEDDQDMTFFNKNVKYSETIKPFQLGFSKILRQLYYLTVVCDGEKYSNLPEPS